MPPQPKLLLLAYACQPNRGSEPGLGWNRALQAARTCRTWVLCEGREFEKPIRDYLAEHGPLPNLEFLFLPRSKWNARLHKLPGLYYVSYRLWHRAALRLAKRLHAEVQLDLVHQVSLCGYREPGYLWRMGIPFIWGPLGGAQNYPWRFVPAAGIGGAIKETIRNLLNTLQLKFSRRVKVAAQHSAKVLAASTTNAAALNTRGIAAAVMLETGAPDVVPGPRCFEHGGPLRILWSGLLEHRKALHLLLNSLAQLSPEVCFELHILGEGPLKIRLQKLARRLGIDSQCHWLGWVPQSQAQAELKWADVFVFSSLRDTSGNVVLEALAAGTPVLTLDHQGAADMVTADCGVKVPVRTPKQVTTDLTIALQNLHRDRSLLKSLSEGAKRRANFYSWQNQGARMAEVYEEALSHTNKGLADCRHERSLALVGGSQAFALTDAGISPAYTTWS